MNRKPIRYRGGDVPLYGDRVFCLADGREGEPQARAIKYVTLVTRDGIKVLGCEAVLNTKKFRLAARIPDHHTVDLIRHGRWLKLPGWRRTDAV
jgi:hypothetical protein